MNEFKIDKTLNKIFLEVEEEFKGQNITTKEVKEIFYLFWSNVRESMRLLTFPTIIIPKWGIFKPSIKNITKYKNNLKKRNDDKSIIVSKSINRLLTEKNNRKRNAN